LPLAVFVDPTVPCPPEHALRKSAAARHAAIRNLSIVSLVLLAEPPPVANPLRAVPVIVVEGWEPV
jgi:hypothetical protein